MTQVVAMGETPVDLAQVVTILYTNHRAQTASRRILPVGIRFTATAWHPEPQWILDAYDLDKNAERSFALQDILNWDPPPPLDDAS